MTVLAPNEEVVKEGVFLYDSMVECDIRIIRSAIHYGSGDPEDSLEVVNDGDLESYYVQFGSTTQRGIFSSGSAGYRSLAEAVSATEALPGIGGTIRWNAHQS